MNVDHTTSASARQIEAAGARPPLSPRTEDGDQAAPRSDRIELSAGAREVSEIDERDAEARLAKVRALRARVDAGTYHVDVDHIARRIVEQGEV